MRNWSSLYVSQLDKLSLKQSIDTGLRHRHIAEPDLNLALVFSLDNLSVGNRVGIWRSFFLLRFRVLILIVKDSGGRHLVLQPLFYLLDLSLDVLPLWCSLLSLELVFALVLIIFAAIFAFLFAVLWLWSDVFWLWSVVFGVRSCSLRLLLGFHYYIDK